MKKLVTWETEGWDNLGSGAFTFHFISFSTVLTFYSAPMSLLFRIFI